ncbi:5-carboxymethyl-2-hydroxymuconate Delta-isomerase [Kitasatospora sp. NPDC048365]|uniref:5-carboxymethyl-2-hydroxymuconate Delta-isomerase n=1 Tax=Kitasatospora sp. NPDC048365 TaxID=3364050 RepID=UPI00371EB177
MPQISVDYSERLADSFDRRAFGLALNRLAVKLIDAKPESCKVRFRRVEESVVGADADTYALVFVQFQIFPGRSPEAKAALSEAVLAELPAHLGDLSAPVDAAVDIKDIDRDCYRGTVLAP